MRAPSIRKKSNQDIPFDGDNGLPLFDAAVKRLQDEEKNAVEFALCSREGSYGITDLGFHLHNRYWDDESNEGANVKVERTENHDTFKVAVIEIAHKKSGKDYIHIGNRFNPISGKHDGEQVRTRKISQGRIQKQMYRIQYIPEKLGERGYPIFCYTGKERDTKSVMLNMNSVIPILNEIESLA